MSKNGDFIIDDPSQVSGIGSKKIDIFQHMKMSLRNSENNCRCPDAKIVYYCIPCKISICSKCGYEEHKKHIIINKADYKMTKENISKMFAPAEQYFNSHDLFKNYESVRNLLVKNVEDTIKNLEEKVKRFKDAKMKELDLMFDNFQTYLDNTKNKIFSTQEELNNYKLKNEKFFNLGSNTNPRANSDNGNTLFLMNYDLLNVSLHSSEYIKQIAKQLSKALEGYKAVQKTELQTACDKVEEVLFNQKDIDEDMEEDVDVSSPMYNFINYTNKLNIEPFKDVDERLMRYNSQIDSFRKMVFNSISKSGNFKDIEKSIAAYENTKQKGADNLFSKRKPNTLSEKNSMRFLHPQMDVSNKEDICLNNPILEKYFAYLTIDLYNNYFKMDTKELQSSHADLMIKINEDEEVDFGKALEGTNEIMIYEKKTQRMFKKVLKLTKNPHGYTKFPIGCRSLLLGDKLYITGGKDESQEYRNVLIYDRKTDSLKRIMDLRIPRAYHTMIYNEVFETIMILGGECNNSVEIFDPLTNRWQLLPHLRYSRANPHFFFDESRGIMYAMFGVEGKITNNLYSDVIEYLDLTNVKEGWLRLDYYNKANLNLRSYLNVCPLNSDLMLIYGGISARNSARNLCVLNVPKKEVGKIDRRLMEALRIEAKKSRKLSSIISSVNN